jgi:beta-phosphoglucomutase
MSDNFPLTAYLFDLDGVIVDTARFHFKAWRRLANELGFDFGEDRNEALKGVGRMESLDIILSWGGVSLSQEEKEEWATRKNDWYLEYIGQMDASEILDGVLPFLDAARSAGKKIAIGSSSKNATKILQTIGIADQFDAIVDGNHLTRSKPDPQVFLLGAEALDIDPGRALVFEDAQSGVEAALAGGFWAVGVGEADVLGKAHLVVPNLIDLTPQLLEERLAATV